MNDTRVSVCLPNFNHSRYLPGAVAALLAQSHPPHEIIIVDDASSDDSVRVLKELSSRHPEIIFLQNDVNQGCCRSTNRAIAASTGDYIFCTAADDLVLPGYFERTTAAMQQHPAAGVCVTLVKYIDETGNEVKKAPKFGRAVPGASEGSAPRFLAPAEVMVQIHRRPWLLYGGPSPLFRRDTIVAAGGLREELGPYTDWFNVHFAALRDGVVAVPEPLVAFRMGAGGFGDSAACSPLIALGKLSQLLQLMRSEPFSRVFPLEFIVRKESDFLYYAFVGGLNVSHRGFKDAINQVAPPVSRWDRLLLAGFALLYLASKAMVFLYSRGKVAPQIRWP
ncbi:MAG: Chondroitin synthase [Verrucomicrobiota bacterium]|jgi:glycosyltransferase involved in cell wall biosynthesis